MHCENSNLIFQKKKKKLKSPSLRQSTWQRPRDLTLFPLTKEDYWFLHWPTINNPNFSLVKSNANAWLHITITFTNNSHKWLSLPFSKTLWIDIYNYTSFPIWGGLFFLQVLDDWMRIQNTLRLYLVKIIEKWQNIKCSGLKMCIFHYVHLEERIKCEKRNSKLLLNTYH